MSTEWPAAAAMTTAVGFNFPTPRRKPGTTTRKCLAVQLAAQPLFSIWLLLLPLLPPAWAQQWPSLQAAQARFPGCCPGSESFDCGDGHCLSVSRFHDGKADCADASDEFCLPGQIQCGRFCADPLHLGECLRNPNCSQTAAAPIFCPLLKRRLCGVANTISCRGYGECIFVKWLMDGKRDCLDGSDENAEYASLFKVNPLREQLLGPAPPPPPPAPAPLPTWPTWPPLPFLFTQPAKTTSAITTTTTTTTTTVMLQTPLREGLGASSSGTPSIWEPMGGEGQWHPRPGQGKEFSGATNQPLPPLIPDQSTEHPSAGGEIGGGDGKASLRLVESTEPGPWQNPPLDDFGGEFARLLVTPSTLAGEWLPPTTSRTETDRQRMEVEKAIVFPVWPNQESSGRGMGAGKLWPGPSEILKEEDGKKSTWPLTTPKYPFDRGKIGVENAGFPFSRPERPTERTKTTKSWETHQPTMATRAENGATERHGKPADIWMPEGGSRTGNAGVPEKGKATQGLNLREEEEEQMGQSEKPAQAFTDRTEETSEGSGMVLTEEPTTMSTAPASASVAPAQPVETVETVETTELSSASSAEGEQSAEPTNSIPTLGGGGPATPMPPQQGWWTPLDWRSLDQVKANLSSQQPGLNCSETVKRMGQQLLPEAAAQRCQCPAGQMRQSNGQCQLAPISTFRVRMDSLCATNKWGDDISLEEQLTLLKMAASLQGQPVCVRDVLDERVIVLNTVCQPTDCSIQDLAAKMQDSDVLPEVKLRIGELPDGACSQFDLNDCEEKAECLVQGLRYRCRCLPGTNDTSDGAGRSCEGTVISMTCTKFLGVCVLVWLLMLLLLCFLLPTISFLCFKYCCEEHPLRERLEYQWHRFKAKMRGQKHLLPIITTSAAPSAGGQRRESAPGPSEFGAHRSSDTLKVPAVMEGPRPYQPPARQQTQTDSEDYLIMEEDEEGIEPEVEEIVEDTARERQQRRESGVDRAQEEESGGGRGGGRGKEKGTSRQQTEQSSSAGTAAGITAGATGAVVAAQQKPEDTSTKNGGQQQQQAQAAAAAATSTAVVASSGTRPPTEEGKGRGVLEPQPERPASVASRAGTPTIWDQFRILGDQYTRLVQIDERRESRNSLEELLEKSKERERSGRMDEAERMKDELDAELRLRRGGEQKELEEDREGEEAVEVAEPGRSMPAPEFGLLPPGALNIGWGFADDIDIPRQIQAGSLPSVPPPRRQFVPKPIREGAARRRAAEETRLSSGSTVVKVPAGQQQRRTVKAGDFVVVKGRRVDREEQRRRLEKLGTPKKEAKSKVEGTSERRDRMRRLRDQNTLEDSLELQQKEDSPKSRKQRPAGVFDPDLPSTSQHQAESVGTQLPRTKETAHEHSAEYLRRRFHTHGRALQAIEEQIEQKVHTGCIVGGRKPWDLSPRPDSLDWLPPLHRRELTQSDEGGLAESQERIESRVHFGCITDRKPWDSSPYRESAIPPRRGRSEYDLRGAGIDQQRLAERRQRKLHSSSNSPISGGRGGRGSSAAGARGRGTTATLGPAPNWLELD